MEQETAPQSNMSEALIYKIRTCFSHMLNIFHDAGTFLEAGRGGKMLLVKLIDGWNVRGLLKALCIDYTCNKSSCVLWSIFPAVFRSVKGQRSLFESEMSLKGQTAAAQTACLQTADASSLIAFG